MFGEIIKRISAPLLVLGAVEGVAIICSFYVGVMISWVKIEELGGFVDSESSDKRTNSSGSRVAGSRPARDAITLGVHLHTSSCSNSKVAPE